RDAGAIRDVHADARKTAVAPQRAVMLERQQRRAAGGVVVAVDRYDREGALARAGRQHQAVADDEPVPVRERLGQRDAWLALERLERVGSLDRKSTRLNSSHV